LRLPDAGGADHNDVLRRDLVAEGLGHLHAAPAVPERDRDGALRRSLADDIAIELGDDLPWRERRRAHPASSSIVSRSFVYTQMAAAMRMDSSTIWRAPSVEWCTSARAAATA